jgi:predicted PurR-regulated permease PerM
MNPPEGNFAKKGITSQTIEVVVRLGAIALLIIYCLRIVMPFILPVIWGIIIAVAIYPAYAFLTRKLGGRRKWASIIVTIGLLLIMVMPVFLFTKSMFEEVHEIRGIIQNRQQLIPPPPENVDTWPVIGHSVYQLWELASTNLGAVVQQFGPQLMTAGKWLLSSLTGTGLALVMFIFSIIISGIMLIYSEKGKKTARDISFRLAGNLGLEYVKDAEITIRKVTKGILGVAFIQAILAGLGFIIGGVPLAGLWTIICLFLAIIQIGIWPVAIIIIIYMFSTAETVTATILTGWLIFVTLADNILRPLMIGRKATVPMMIIFIGSLGGFIASGIIGLFVGAIVLSLGYKLFLLWLKGNETAEEFEVQ